MAGQVTLQYADAGELASQIQKVRSQNEAAITAIINRRVSNGLSTQQRTAAIAKLQSQFKPNLDELDQINIQFAQKVQQGMDGFRGLDQAGARAFQ